MDIQPGIAALRSRLDEERRHGRSIALVPTMGNLHEGHVSLVSQARSLADVVVASLFVNRLQFAPGEDFDRYPRTFEADCDRLRAAGTDVLFAPGEPELYPEPQDCFVEPPPVAATLEGVYRPGFFRGVATVVLKLLNIVQPHTAVFGKKDYQQLAVVRSMVRQLQLPVHVAAGETVRAPDGLALSSRNGYLSASERSRAPQLYEALSDVATALGRGAADFPALESQARAKLLALQWDVDYVAVRKQSDLQSPRPGDGALVVLGAARLGTTRLIDNIEVGR